MVGGLEGMFIIIKATLVVVKENYHQAAAGFMPWNSTKIIKKA